MAYLEPDLYQKRYLEHQGAKKAQLSPTSGESEWRQSSEAERVALFELLGSRRTQRTFITKPIEQEKLDRLAEAIVNCPSSCNRQAIKGRLISERDDKELLSGLLVGGVGWSYRADRLLLLFADMQAYKSPAERDFMPYLDAGAMVMTIHLTCESMNIGVGYINPNIREKNQDFFIQRFGDDQLLFCGAMALGYYDLRSKRSPRRTPQEFWLR